MSATPIGATPPWFKTAVFYEVLVRAFKDTKGAGVGDFVGLMQSLDYLQWLGVDCLWLPPFFDSPMRDGGYDVADYCSVHPDVGNLGDFVHFVDEAKARGIRVIIDFVLNHTSDQHAWFKESQTDPTGRYGDFYVWSDDPTKYDGVRIIFSDTEASNWEFDPIRGQYYWHRFFSHQPDLNFDNPAVADAVIECMRFWLDLGVDGFRLDAVPYLFEEEGTECAHLPATHGFIRRIRALLDAEYPGRVLLAEANGWPTDVAQYFGDGDECHMAFNFPLMPRLFMALRKENREPISDIMAQTPELPANCQWGGFLRNHDELTLEMVTDEERDYMYEEYARDPRMKANVGICRRLAPLLENSRDQMELLTAMLLSLPGSPILYYGDEIGMGDNVELGDRDGVRTPMQWSQDRNGGFSSADPGTLYLPVITDPVFGYLAVNVEAELAQSHSLLNWTQRMISARKRTPSFGLGSYLEVPGSNPSTYAFIRRFEDEVVLCVYNLSQRPQPTTLYLNEWSGYRLVEVTGGVSFPPIGESPYSVTLGPHGFYWFRLEL